MGDNTDFWIRPGILDPKHCNAIGEALWLYLYVHRECNWETGVMKGYQHSKAANSLGTSISTVKRWFTRLVGNRYIESKRLPYGLDVMITKYIPQSQRVAGKRKVKRSVNNELSGSVNNELSRGGRDSSYMDERSVRSGPDFLIGQTNQTIYIKDDDISSSKNVTSGNAISKAESLVKAAETALEYGEYENRDDAIEEAEKALAKNAKLTPEDIAGCVAWMLAQPSGFWLNLTVTFGAIVKQMPGYRRHVAQKNRPKETAREREIKRYTGGKYGHLVKH